MNVNVQSGKRLLEAAQFVAGFLIAYLLVVAVSMTAGAFGSGLVKWWTYAAVGQKVAVTALANLLFIPVVLVTWRWRKLVALGIAVFATASLFGSIFGYVAFRVISPK